LPQLINVLRGEMSLVGPRPATIYEYELFQPRHRRRCETLPGLTGLWQVNGKNRTTFDEMMDLDLTYVETKSFLLDAKILIGTLPAIILQVFDVRASRKAAAKAAPAEMAAPGAAGRGSRGQSPMESSREAARSGMTADRR
jgi:lipopolysaccharide/colanic/teichoic acid biosynthesis glycosyltransferase